MGENPALWADIARDLDAALRHARQAAGMRDALLAGGMDGLTADAYGLAVGKHLDDAFAGTERALERIIIAIDGDRPQGRDSHRALLLRAATEVPGLRSAILDEAHLEELFPLLSFRHVFRNSYMRYDPERAMPNVAAALDALPDVAARIESFCREFGIAPMGEPRRYGGVA
jgi:hypothetical protein